MSVKDSKEGTGFLNEKVSVKAAIGAIFVAAASSAIAYKVFSSDERSGVINKANEGSIVFVSHELNPVSRDDINNAILQLEASSNSSYKLAVDTDIDSISLSAVLLEDKTIGFASHDGKYLFEGIVTDLEKDISVNDLINSKIKFSRSEPKANDQVVANKRSEKYPKKERVEKEESGKIQRYDSEDYKNRMLSRLESIGSAKKVETVSAPKLAHTQNHSVSAPTLSTDDDCLITFGGFDQPKIGYDDKCNVLSESQKQEQVKTLINGFPDQFFIRYEAEDEKSEIYVFTDYTCGYCQKLHRNIDGFLKNGISVNYILYPRAISMQGQDAMAKRVVTDMSSAWCSDNQTEATDLLYKNRTIPYTQCNKNDKKLDSPVRQHYILGMMFDISGTPLIVGSNGNTTYGFRSISTTLSRLKL